MARIALNWFEMNVEIVPAVLPMDTVFIHGNLASNRWWHPAMELWQKSARSGLEGRAILAEWRGSGASAAPRVQAELDPHVLAQDYIDLLTHLKINRACIVGHSTGGLIGLIAMMKAPALFDSAVFLDPVSAKGVQFEAPMLDTFTQMSQDREFCATILNSTIHQNDPKSSLFQKLVDDAFGIANLNWHGVLKELSKVDVTAGLAKVMQPTLILHGEFDAILPKEGSVAMAKALPHGEFRELTGQGHSLNIENPQAFTSIVSQFLFNR